MYDFYYSLATLPVTFHSSGIAKKVTMPSSSDMVVGRKALGYGTKILGKLANEMILRHECMFVKFINIIGNLGTI